MNIPRAGQGNCQEATKAEIVSILEEAIRSEAESEEKYLHAAGFACEVNVRDLLISLAAMEREHKERLTRELDELRAQMTIVGEMNEMFL